MNKQYKNIIWDYNGTIVDDAALAVKAENMVLETYGKPPITLDFYLKECEMPILNFYNKIFDMNSFDFTEISQRFIKYYEHLSHDAKVFPEVKEMICSLSQKGYNQAVISGFESEMLKKSLHHFGLSDYFSFMSGSDDISCKSKSERAALVLKKYGLKPSETLFIGDMYHDLETAAHVGADCILISKGHQGHDVLSTYDVRVLKSAAELKEILLL
ncbi:MAG: HAD family hydrolase [Lachnospiraceae bacterium]|nr:HAD family hydrolase [Lachnospiraceae bacterium]